MARWHIAETKKLIELHFGWDQHQRSRHCIRAVQERLRHARYHFSETRRLLKEAIDSRLPGESIYSITWPSSSEEYSTLESELMKAEAHSIACAVAIHSIADNLAHVAYFALGLNLGPNPLRERDVTAKSVVQALRRSFRPDETAAQTIEHLLADQAFQTISAFVNVAKHRGFSESRINLEPENRGEPYLFEFGSFTYDGVAYAEREIEEVLAPAYAEASSAVVHTGIALHERLLARTAP